MCPGSPTALLTAGPGGSCDAMPDVQAAQHGEP